MTVIKYKYSCIHKKKMWLRQYSNSNFHEPRLEATPSKVKFFQSDIKAIE